MNINQFGYFINPEWQIDIAYQEEIRNATYILVYKDLATKFSDLNNARMYFTI